MSKPSWHAAYLYYAEPWHPFLGQFLYGWIQENLVSAGVPYFFIRYWEQGPHIRFRFFCGPATANIVRQRLETAYHGYCQKQPANYDYYGFSPEDLVEINEAWRPNNSLHWVQYEPEIQRYGGIHGLPLCEAHFNDSSSAVLQMLHQEASWSYTHGLTAALQMHLLFARAANLSPEELLQLFHFVFLSWFPRAVDETNSLTAEERVQKQNEILKLFQQQWDKQREALQPFITTMWQTPEADMAEVLETPVYTFYQKSRETVRQLEAAFDQGKLENPGWLNYLPNSNELSEKQKTLWAIYGSFIHMTNNRLGVLNRDEGFIAFLIKQGIEGMKASV